ncbi:MAG TPA: NADPH-dependent FMN reductase [Bryobacteraceae bacterium]|nr:NADPH-dependent FMN reductase [Bryobacteraceae bacterium]
MTPLRPFILGIGGSTRAESTGERALHVALRAAEEAGARTALFNGAFLARLPVYASENRQRNAEQRELVEAVRLADGLILASPGYHGGISGLVKNALDLLEDLRDDPRPYLDGRAVGCIVTASGWQTIGTSLVALRSVVHALRGWPTPLGAGLNMAEKIFDSRGACIHPGSATQLAIVGRQVVEFAHKWTRSQALGGSGAVDR